MGWMGVGRRLRQAPASVASEGQGPASLSFLFGHVLKDVFFLFNYKSEWDPSQ